MACACACDSAGTRECHCLSPLPLARCAVVCLSRACALACIKDRGWIALCVCAGAGPKVDCAVGPYSSTAAALSSSSAPPFTPLARATAIEALRNKVTECQQAAAASAEQQAEEQGEAAEDEL